MRRRPPAAPAAADVVNARARFFELLSEQWDVLEAGYDDATARDEWNRLADEIKALGRWWDDQRNGRGERPFPAP